MRALLDTAPMPSAPVSEPWTLTISTLIGRWDRLPPQVIRMLSILDRAGSIRLTPMRVGFDDQDVEWGKVRELRMLPVSHSLSKAAFSHELERLSRLLPPVPGRRKFATRIGAGLAHLAGASLNREGDDRLVVSELVYSTTFGRTRVMTTGAFVTALLGAVEAVNYSVIVTAKAHGAEVYPS